MSDGDVPILSCPRCGYDQRGAAGPWAASCPCRGQCAECGLEYLWAELFRPRLTQPRWSVEAGRGLLPRPRQIVLTLATSLLPLRFWRHVRMPHPFRPWRVGCYLTALVLVVMGLYVSTQTIVAARADRAFATFVGMGGGTDIRRSQRFVQIYLKAIFMPGATEQTTFEFPDGTVARWVAPTDFAYYATPRSLAAGGWWNHDLRFAPTAMFQAGMVACLMPLSFIVLPATRRRCRVRWSHVVRAFGFGLGPLLLLAMVFGASYLTMIALDDLGFSSRVAAVMRSAVWIAPVLMLAVWWWAAIARYLCLPRATITTALLLLMSLLGSLVIWYVAAPQAMTNALRVLFLREGLREWLL